MDGPDDCVYPRIVCSGSNEISAVDANGAHLRKRETRQAVWIGLVLLETPTDLSSLPILFTLFQIKGLVNCD